MSIVGWFWARWKWFCLIKHGVLLITYLFIKSKYVLCNGAWGNWFWNNLFPFLSSIAVVSVFTRPCPSLRQPQPYLRDSFSPNLNKQHKTSWTKILIVLGGLLTMTFKVKFNLKLKIYPSWDCPRHNSPSFEVRTSKFAPIMRLSNARGEKMATACSEMGPVLSFGLTGVARH